MVGFFSAGLGGILRCESDCENGSGWGGGCESWIGFNGVVENGSGASEEGGVGKERWMKARARWVLIQTALGSHHSEEALVTGYARGIGCALRCSCHGWLGSARVVFV